MKIKLDFKDVRFATTRNDMVGEIRWLIVKFGGKTMRVCVIERDHKPLMDVRNPGHVLAFADDAKGVAAMKRRLNRYPQNGSSPYYDAVLYERIEPGPKEGVTA